MASEAAAAFRPPFYSKRNAAIERTTTRSYEEGRRFFFRPRASALKSEALKRALDCSRNNNSLLSWASRVLFDRPRQQQQGPALVDGPPSRGRCSVGVDGNRQQFSNIFFPPFLSRLLPLALRRPLPLAIWPSRGQQKNVCICHQH